MVTPKSVNKCAIYVISSGSFSFRKFIEKAHTYLASTGFFLANLLACTKSLASPVFHVVGKYTSRERQIQETRTTSSC